MSPSGAILMTLGPGFQSFVCSYWQGLSFSLDY